MTAGKFLFCAFIGSAEKRVVDEPLPASILENRVVQAVPVGEDGRKSWVLNLPSKKLKSKS